jgi:hypothetical protein
MCAWCVVQLRFASRQFLGARTVHDDDHQNYNCCSILVPVLEIYYTEWTVECLALLWGLMLTSVAAGCGHVWWNGVAYLYDLIQPLGASLTDSHPCMIIIILVVLDCNVTSIFSTTISWSSLFLSLLVDNVFMFITSISLAFARTIYYNCNHHSPCLRLIWPLYVRTA